MQGNSPGVRLADWAAIAGVGANFAGIAEFGLSVVNYWGRRQERRPSLKITFTLDRHHGFFRSGVHAVNTRQRMVRVEEAGLLLPNKDKLEFRSIYARGSPTDVAGDSMPHELGQAQTCSRYVYKKVLNDYLSKAGYGGGGVLRGYVLDAESRLYKSKPQKYGASRFASDDIDF